jgi:uncharacterized membrane protein YagU involved in acid resistance
MQDYSFKANFIVTLIFNAVTCFISIIFPNIKSVISIMGGLIAVSMCYLVPLICQLRLSDKSWASPYNLSAICFFGSLILIGYTSVGVTIYEVINGLDMMPRL